MNRYLLDSSIIIALFKKREPGYSIYTEIAKTTSVVNISIVTVTEVLAGWDNNQKAKYLDIFYNLANVLPITLPIVEKAAQIKKQLSQKGIMLHTIDSIIASTALEENLTLVTLDTRDFHPVPNLHIFTALESPIGKTK